MTGQWKRRKKRKRQCRAEDRQEFDDIILKWENVIEYTWVTEPEIEAENITFIQAGDSEDFSLNEREKAGEIRIMR